MPKNIIDFNYDELMNLDVYVDGKHVDPRLSQRVWNHSPCGFSIGYGGSGPAQCALGILLRFTDQETAVRLHQTFKWEHVATWQPHEIIKLDIQQWIKNKVKELDHVTPTEGR